MSISVIKKRDGRIVPFDVKKISDAINRSFIDTDSTRSWEELSTSLALEVYTLLDLEGNPAPTVEHVQDIVEHVLMREGYSQTAKNYIIYRQERSRARARTESAGDAIRFGGKALDLTEILSPGTSVTETVLSAYVAIRNNHYSGQTVSGLDRAFAPIIASTFGLYYRQALALCLELLAGVPVSDSTMSTYAAGLAQKGLYLSLEPSAGYLSREADIICGTLGCDRDTVQQAQDKALRRAGEATRSCFQQALSALLRALQPLDCPAEAFSFDPSSTPEAALVADIIYRESR